MAGSGLESIREVEAILTGSAQLPDRGAGFFAFNPPIGTATSPVQGVVRDWGGEVFNVMAPQNPGGAAVGDGSATDTSPMTNLITAAGAGCNEYPAPKTFLFDNTLLWNTVGATIKGASRGGTVLKEKAGSNLGYTFRFDQNHIHMCDLTIDGNGANNPTEQDAVKLWNNYCSVANVRAINWKNGAFTIQGTNSRGTVVRDSWVENGLGNTGIAVGTSGNQFRITGNFIDNQVGNGILINGAGVTQGIIGFNSVVNPGGNPTIIGIAFGSNASYITAIGNLVVNSSDCIDAGSSSDSAIIGNMLLALGGTALTADTGQRAAVVGNVALQSITAYNGSTDNIGVTGRDHVYVANIAHGAGVGGTVGGFDFDCVRYMSIMGNLTKNNAGVGFGLHKNNAGSANPDRLLLIGNIAYDDRVTKVQSYGFQMASTTRSITVAHNDFRGNLTGAINDLGSDTYTHGVVGYNPRGVLTWPSIPATGVIQQNPFNCDGTLFIAGGTLTAIKIGGLPAPANWGAQPTLTDAATGGTLVHGTTAAYRCAARNQLGHTVECVEVTIVLGGGADTHAVTIALPTGTGLRGVTGWDIFGRISGAEQLMALNWQKDLFVDDGSITPSGAMPGTDTTGNTAIPGITAAAPAGAVHTIPIGYGESWAWTGTVAPTTVGFKGN